MDDNASTTGNTDNTENTIVCLNYCMTDPETGYCLTCGRPPAPVVAFNPRFFGRLSLADMTIVETPGKASEITGQSREDEITPDRSLSG